MLRLLCVLSLGLVATALARDVPYVPTPHAVVEKMLEVAKVGPNDLVYDLGSGDGRIVIAAALAERTLRGYGVDIDARLVAQANDAARAAGVADRVRFAHRNAFDADLLISQLLAS